ncbi:MAG: hypothetical protein ACT6T3_21925, partial [Agrobacterium sp.]|uniref:hypothetical protein n=1 Tax=Agrobacterium sp. TaxID=361 RepID=UPI0040334CC3
VDNSALALLCLEALQACNTYYGLITHCTPITSLPKGEHLGEKLREAMQVLKRSTKLLSSARQSSLAAVDALKRTCTEVLQQQKEQHKEQHKEQQKEQQQQKQ